MAFEFLDFKYGQYRILACRIGIYNSAFLKDVANYVSNTAFHILFSIYYVPERQ